MYRARRGFLVAIPGATSNLDPKYTPTLWKGSALMVPAGRARLHRLDPWRLLAALGLIVLALIALSIALREPPVTAPAAGGRP